MGWSWSETSKFRFRIGAAHYTDHTDRSQMDIPMNFSNRCVQLVAGIIGMVAVANFQYSWTLFVLPLQDRHGWKEVDIQYALYLFFVPAQTWLVPLEGYLAERFGLRKLLISGG